MNLSNQYLEELEYDTFHHLGFTSSNAKESFHDVKFVCVSGSNGRVNTFAHYINDQLKLMKSEDVKNICTTDRFVLYKVGPVLAASHGMGTPSTSILLHELFKLLHYSGASDVTFFRLGTSGGLGFEEGSIVISSQALNGMFKPNFNQVVLGETIEHATGFNEEFISELVAMAIDLPYDVKTGATMCCDDFYEGQGRLDGAFCSYTKADKKAYLQKAYEAGVRNIEMESTVFSAMCLRAGVKAAVICVVLVDRLIQDQILISKDKYSDIQKRPWEIVLKYIKSRLPLAVNGS